MNPLHDHVLDRLDAYLDGTLSPADEAEVRRHCRACETCRAAFESLRGVPGKPGPGADRRSSPSHPGGRGRRFWRSFWMTWAAAAVVLGGVSVYYSTLKPTPYDLRVLGQSSWLPGSDAALHLRVLRHDGGAEPDVPVTVELARQGAGDNPRVQLASVKTGAHGEAVPRFRLPDWPDGSYRLEVTASPRGARSPETATRTIVMRHSWRLLASTDKPVYQPGQVIRHARAGAAAARSEAGRRPGHELLPDRPARQRRLPRRQADQPVRHRLGRLPDRRRGHRGQLPGRVPRRRYHGRRDGRGPALRPAAVQGRDFARSALLPARPADQGAQCRPITSSASRSRAARSRSRSRRPTSRRGRSRRSGSAPTPRARPRSS